MLGDQRAVDHVKRAAAVVGVCALVVVPVTQAAARTNRRSAIGARATTTPAATRLINTRPVTARSEPRSGLTIRVAAQHATCEAGSDSVGNAYRCFAGNEIYDPCWADETPGRAPSVLCQSAPWQHTLIRLRLTAGLPPFLSAPQPPELGDPWGVQLTDGTRCLAAQGAHGTAFGKVIEYSCENSSLVLLGTMSVSHGVGRFETAIYDQTQRTFAHGPGAIVRTAWYAIPDDGDQLAAQQGRCTAPALAEAAQTRLTAHQRIYDGSTITRFACDGGYALVRRTTYHSSGLLLFKDAAHGWQQIATGDIRPGPSTAPASVLDTLAGRLAHAGDEAITY
jgi:hypothetical protein